jgi:hypothetical protein
MSQEFTPSIIRKGKVGRFVENDETSPLCKIERIWHIPPYNQRIRVKWADDKSVSELYIDIWKVKFEEVLG